jgi:hypothetical protein
MKGSLEMTRLLLEEAKQRTFIEHELGYTIHFGQKVADGVFVDLAVRLHTDGTWEWAS